MADTKELITDPDNVPVRFVNGAHCTAIGHNLALTLNTLRIKFDAEGKVQEDRVFAARLRFDLEMAKIIRDQLDYHINAFAAPADVKPN